MITSPPKDPSAVLDYSLDWTDWLEGETISSFTITVDPSGSLTVDSSSDDGSIVSYRLSGGTAGTMYSVTIQITTSAGQVEERTVRQYVMDR